jgi:hypothetical protein
MVLQMVSTLVELIQLGRTLASDKALEIALSRRQLAIYERKQTPVVAAQLVQAAFPVHPRKV